LGDFFDIIMESPKGFSKNKEYQEIFNLLNVLQKNQDLKVIFTPGNHEIPIWGNEDRRFKRRKRRLINKFQEAFEENKIGINFLSEENFCQYVILDNEDKNFRISLFNTKKTMKKFINNKRISRREWIRQKTYEIAWSNNNKFKCLLCHGHQFDPIKNIASLFWSIGIYAPQIFKKMGNFLWNGIIKGGLMIKWRYSKILKNKLIEKNLIFDTASERKILTIITNSKKLEVDPDNIIFNDLHEKYINNIAEFVKKLKLKRIKIRIRKLKKPIAKKSGISHFIFGHSHKEFRTTVKDISLSLVNSGSWQRLLDPIIISVINKGRPIRLRKFRVPKEFKLLFMILAAVNQLIFLLGQLIVINSRKLIQRDRFTSMEILQKSKVNREITLDECKTIKKYYDFEITNVNNLNFNQFFKDINSIYTRTYRKVKRIIPKFSFTESPYREMRSLRDISIFP